MRPEVSSLSREYSNVERPDSESQATVLARRRKMGTPARLCWRLTNTDGQECPAYGSKLRARFSRSLRSLCTLDPLVGWSPPAVRILPCPSRSTPPPTTGHRF